MPTYPSLDAHTHKLVADSLASFESGSLDSTIRTGFHTLDHILARFINYETILSFTDECEAALAPLLAVSELTPMLGALGAELLHGMGCLGVLWRSAEDALVAGGCVVSSLGLGYGELPVLAKGLAQAMEAADCLLLGLEVTCAVFLLGQLAALRGRLQRQASGYDDVVTFCQVRGVSVAEVFGLLTFALGLVLFDMFVSLAEDDSLEALSYVFATVIACAVLLLLLAVDVQFYYLVSSISGGELTLRVLYTDVVNNALCLLRVFFCWVRYIFYDLQAELVDLAFHYTELGDELSLEALPEPSLAEGSVGALLASLTGALLPTFLDLTAMIFQLLIGAFKLALALFLFWLILDLFLLRTIAHTELSGLLRGGRQRLPS